LNENVFFQKLSMSVTFGVFVYSLISPMYIFVTVNTLPAIVYGRIPGMGIRMGSLDYIALSVFFSLLVFFFASHVMYEKGIVKRIVCAASAVYCALYLAVIVLVGIYGLVIFNFPIISIPLGIVLLAKLFILFPATYFFMVSLDKKASVYIRFSAFVHAVSLVTVGIIKVFEMLFSATIRLLVFDISTAVYLISLSMVTFFMYRKYYEQE